MNSLALVVGLGKMGRIHAKVLRDLGYTVRTVDPDPRVDADHVSIARAGLGRRYDVAVIATPAEHLVDSAFQLAGTAQVIEKPFATNARDAAMLAAFLEKQGAPVAVDFTERFNPKVRRLRDDLHGIQAFSARFTRWSTRPSWNIDLDLLIHDVDLAHHLGLHGLPEDRITYDVRAEQAENVRRIQVRGRSLEYATFTADLLAHDQSPLHALWHSFLTSHPDTPRPADAVRALIAIETGAARRTQCIEESA